MKKQEKKRLLVIKENVANLNNLYSIKGGTDGTGGETTTKGDQDRKKAKCIKTSKEFVFED